MVKTITVLVCLLLATSAGAQSRLYTNADVGRPLSPNRPSVTSEQLAGLKAREFHLPLTDPSWPDVTVVRHDPDWPFPTSTREAIAQPLFQPWSMSTYVGRRGFQGDSRRAGDHGSSSRGSARRASPLSPARP